MLSKDFISVFWAWNSDLNRDQIKSQLFDFKEKGINNVFVHARAGLKVKYMGDEWLGAFKYTLEVAKELGNMYVWIYDENGWPSGFGGGIVYETNDEFKERYLIKIKENYKTIRSYNREIIKVYDDELNDVTDKIASFSDDDVYNFILFIKNDYYIDITNKDAVKCFLDTTHEVYKKNFKEYFGNVIPGVFTDEPHCPPDGLPVGKYINLEYEKRYNTKIYDDIKDLFFDTNKSSLIRYRYRKLLTELINTNYTIQYNNWCKENNLILTGHYTCEEGIVDQVPTSGKLMTLYENMGLIGIDSLGNRLCPLPTYRRSYSSCWQNDSRSVLIETYAGTGYDATFDELLRIWAFEAINGVTHPCLSISVMSVEGNRKRDYPEYFSNQLPWWDEAKHFFDSMKFIKNEISGERKQKVLLIEPISSIYVSNHDDAMAVSSSFRVLNESLFYSQVDFDYADEDKIKDAKIENGRIHIGSCSYENIILPFSYNIESGVLEKIKEFSQIGGMVYVVGNKPIYLDGIKQDIKFDFSYTTIMPRYNFIRKLSEINHLHNDILVTEKETRKTNSKLAIAYRTYEKSEKLFILNPSRNEEVSGRIVAKGKRKAYINTLDSTIDLTGTYNFIDDTTEFLISLKEMEYISVTVENGLPVKSEKYIESLENLYPIDIIPSLNSFSLDKASISINDSKFDERDYVLNKTKILYKKINGKGNSKVKVRYEFKISEELDTLFMVVEGEDFDIFVNNNKVSNPEKAFFESGRRFDISRYINIGMNEIVLEKNLEPFFDPILGENVFQSIGNIYSFPFYIESIYLEGNFKTISSEEVSLITHVVSKDDFKLVKTDKLLYGDITTQGYNFFRGYIKSTYSFINDSNDKVLLSFDNTYAVVNILFINNNKIYVRSKDEIDITKYLINGLNKIEFLEYSGLRNTFGPLHHVYGKHFYTGPSVFEGYSEWQDAVIFPELKGNTYISEYSFVHLNVPVLKLKKIKK